MVVIDQLILGREDTQEETRVARVARVVPEDSAKPEGLEETGTEETGLVYQGSLA